MSKINKYKIKYNLPEVRGILHKYIEAANEGEARELFNKELPKATYIVIEKVESRGVNMFEDVVSKLTNDTSKKKDKWFLETLKKHNLINSNDLSNFDFYWLSQEMGIKLTTQDNVVSLYQDGLLLGEWYEPQLINTGDNIYKLDYEYWN